MHVRPYSDLQRRRANALRVAPLVAEAGPIAWGSRAPSMVQRRHALYRAIAAALHMSANEIGEALGVDGSTVAAALRAGDKTSHA